MLAEDDAQDAANGVERLGDIEPAGGRLGTSHRHDIGIGRGLQHGTAAGHDVDGNKVEGVTGCLGCGHEEDGASGIEDQPQDDATLVGVLADEQGRRQGNHEVGPVESELDERGLCVAHVHNPLERAQQRVGHVVGYAPEEEQAGDEDEGQEVLPGDDGCLLLCHVGGAGGVIADRGETFVPSSATSRPMRLRASMPGRGRRSLPIPAAGAGWPAWPWRCPSRRRGAPPLS